MTMNASPINIVKLLLLLSVTMDDPSHGLGPPNRFMPIDDASHRLKKKRHIMVVARQR